MQRILKEVKTEQIKRAFQKETGLDPEEIKEISECYPMDLHASIHTIDRTFIFKLTFEGRAKKGTFEEEK
jgi:hypothetical protein